MSKHSQFYKSVRSGGGLFSKGITQLNATTSNFHPDRNEEMKGSFQQDPLGFDEESDFNPPNSYLVLEPRHTYNHRLDSVNKMNYSGPAYMNSTKEVLAARPSTSDNKGGRVQKFEFRMERPSTSKPHKNSGRLQRGRTRVLSQEEYKVLQHSEKKKRKPRHTTIGSVQKFAEGNHRLSIKSGKKTTVLEQITNNINIFEEREPQRLVEVHHDHTQNFVVMEPMSDQGKYC